VTRLGDCDFSPIGRWLILGSFSENEMGSLNLWATFFHGKSYVLIVTKIRVGLHFGRFFASSSGHTGGERRFRRKQTEKEKRRKFSTAEKSAGKEEIFDG
jgi:hypothetical protein